VIVYAEHEEIVSTRTLIRQIEGADPLERLIRLGQLEAGIVDALCPEVDDTHSIAESLRRIALGDDPIGALRLLVLPEAIRVRPPEGYAFYSVYPEQYERAARRFVSERSPRRCVVLGIRSIGTSLSAVVAQTMRRNGVVVASWTVRPHGHPFDRRLVVSDRLRAIWHQHVGDWFCIVDEGPGISGSTFASVAKALSVIGVPDDRIVMFPSHEPPVRNYATYVEPFPQELFIPEGARDMSGGLWREVSGCWPAVQPQHERRKYLHEGKLWKFTGLAHLGRSRFERGLILSDAAFIPRVVELRDGFIVSEFVHRSAAGDLLDVIAKYLAFLRREFATNSPVRYSELAGMIQSNTGIETPDRDALIEDGVVVELDGRMLPHEWIGSLKTDALDHYNDHFFPGCQDIAWDIAGACVEFGLPDEALVDRYLAIENDRTLRRRLQFYRTAYLAYRIGYVDMARQALGDSADGPRFGALKNFYMAALVEAPVPTSSTA
jgi:hypothetical protein